MKFSKLKLLALFSLFGPALVYFPKVEFSYAADEDETEEVSSAEAPEEGNEENKEEGEEEKKEDHEDAFSGPDGADGDGHGHKSAPMPAWKKRMLIERQAYGAKAHQRFEAEAVIKSRYKLDGRVLEVDPN